jgi:tetrahydromethanopterin S-methyltransferase subunit F
MTCSAGVDPYRVHYGMSPTECSLLVAGIVLAVMLVMFVVILMLARSGP